MKELFDGLWKIAPRLMSLVVIFICIFYAAFELATFQQKLDNMDHRLVKVEDKLIDLDQRMTRVEVRLDRLEQKVESIDGKLDKLIEILITQKPTGK